MFNYAIILVLMEGKQSKFKKSEALSSSLILEASEGK